MGSGFSKMKKQARLMQEQMQVAQDKMKKLEVTGSSGGGLVSLALSGNHELLRIQIQKECVDVNDLEGLQDLILLAHKDAVRKLQEQETSSFPFPM